LIVLEIFVPRENITVDMGDYFLKGDIVSGDLIEDLPAEFIESRVRRVCTVIFADKDALDEEIPFF